ncbi:helix-turn-helix domain-containing protein [Streptomyces finlayi]|uniref:Helix-turn-helix domain-containing protein n=1 Tax=Streptomyces finlayi TaxID=67296 RepID=A0A7G7BKY2_9ACTN|nr:helix-turn-helix domain-containing protein [Streptomyces finlayi]QNE75997.1 helix-turn-helix domain-containing protein [Streptomyces finlayi]
MELEERVTELERRLAALERPTGPELTAHEPERYRPERYPIETDFWALEGLKRQLSDIEGSAGDDGGDDEGTADGGVLYTGAVRLPTGEQYEWQYGTLTAQVLGTDEDSPGWSDVAESLAALGHPVRLRLLREILAGRRTAAELATLDGVGTTGQIYHHLRQLTGAGWLHTTGRGRYEVPGVRVVPLLVVLTAGRR